MVDVAQQVRASDCGSEGRRFEPDLPPTKNNRIPVVFLCPYGLDLRIESYCCLPPFPDEFLRETRKK